MRPEAKHANTPSMARTVAAAKLGVGGPTDKVDAVAKSPPAVAAPVGEHSTPSAGGNTGQTPEELGPADVSVGQQAESVGGGDPAGDGGSGDGGSGKGVAPVGERSTPSTGGDAGQTLELCPAEESAGQQAESADGGDPAGDGGSGNGGRGDVKAMEMGGRKYQERDADSDSESDELASQNDGSQGQGDAPAAEEYLWTTSRGEVKDMRKMSVTTLKDTVSIDIESTVQAAEKNLQRRGRSVAKCINTLHNTEALTFDGPGGEKFAQDVFKSIALLFQDYADNEGVLKAFVKANELIAAQYIDLPRNLKAANARKVTYDRVLADKVAAQEAQRKEKEAAKVAKEKEQHKAKVAAAAKRKLQDSGGKRSAKKTLMLK